MFKRNFMIIMDNVDDWNVVKNITGVVDMIIKKRHGKTLWRTIDDDNPNCRVTVVKTTVGTINDIRDIVDKMYPGCCRFKKM